MNKSEMNFRIIFIFIMFQVGRFGTLFPQIEDINVTEEQIRKQTNANLATINLSQSSNPDFALWMQETYMNNQFEPEIKEFVKKIKEVQKAKDNNLQLKDVFAEIAFEIFNEEKQNLGQSKFDAFVSKVDQLNKIVFVYLYKVIKNSYTHSEFNELVKQVFNAILQRLVKESKEYSAKTKTLITITTTITKNIEAIIKFTDKVNKRLRDYKQFKRDPISTISQAISNIIAQVQNSSDPKLNLEDAFGKVLEYIDAIKLIHKQQAKGEKMP